MASRRERREAKAAAKTEENWNALYPKGADEAATSGWPGQDAGPSNIGRPLEWDRSVILRYTNGLHDEYRGRAMLRSPSEVPADVRRTALAFVSLVEMGMIMLAINGDLRLPSDDPETGSATPEEAAATFMAQVNLLGGALGIPELDALESLFKVVGLDSLLAEVGESLRVDLAPSPIDGIAIFGEPEVANGSIPEIVMFNANRVLSDTSDYHDAMGFPLWDKARTDAFTSLGEKGSRVAELTPALGWFKTMRKLDAADK